MIVILAVGLAAGLGTVLGVCAGVAITERTYAVLVCTLRAELAAAEAWRRTHDGVIEDIVCSRSSHTWGGRQ